MRVSMSIMGIILLCAIGAVGVIIASDQRIQSGDDESSRKN